ncbi:MAG: hypothetical protein IJP78_00220, partial [Clostridia bacterium]|nr:hypothetical protein [Clostridia bacterium]
DAFGVHHRHLPLPPRAAALAPLRGYPISRNDEAETDEARTTKKEQRRRQPTMKKTREELQNELAEAQRQYDQEQHRQQ